MGTTGAPGTDLISRRSLLESGLVTAGGLAAVAVLGACGSSKAAGPAAGAASAKTTAGGPVTDGEQALRRLMAGNARFVAGAPSNAGRDGVRRAAVADEQRPFAIILGCADSRVTPEVLFDEGIGDLFLVRVAGNTAAEPVVVGSIEYAAEHLGSVLLMVLGHERCGAVKATIDHVEKGGTEDGHIGALVDPIVPAVEAVKGEPADRLVNAAVQQNVRRQVQTLSASTPLIAPLVSEGRLKVVGAEYYLESGRVELVS